MYLHQQFMILIQYPMFFQEQIPKKLISQKIWELKKLNRDICGTRNGLHKYNYLFASTYLNK